MKLRLQHKVDNWPEGSEERRQIERQFKPIVDAYFLLSSGSNRRLYDDQAGEELKFNTFRESNVQSAHQSFSRSRPSENDEKNARAT